MRIDDRGRDRASRRLGQHFHQGSAVKSILHIERRNLDQAEPGLAAGDVHLGVVGRHDAAKLHLRPFAVDVVAPGLHPPREGRAYPTAMWPSRSWIDLGKPWRSR